MMVALVRKDADHATLSASGAHRWLECPASVKMEDGIVDEGSDFAREGSLAHDYAEKALLAHEDAERFLEPISKETLFSDPAQRVVDYLQLYLDHVRALKGPCFVESRVDFSRWVPGGFGTADFVCFSGDVLHVVDLKYGKGIKVEAKNNPQAMLYALGAYASYSNLFEFEKVRIGIVQPRLDHIDEWEIPVEDLLQWAEGVKFKAARCFQEDPPFGPSEKACQWCKAKGLCKPYAEAAVQIATQGFEMISAPGDFKALNSLKSKDFTQLLHKHPLLKAWLSEFEKASLAFMLEGNEVPGFKLVEGRSMRKWGDEAEAEKALKRLLKTKAYTKKILSPTQAEKVLSAQEWEGLSSHCIKPSGKPTIAQVSDKRPALTFEDPTQGFEAA